MENFDISKEFIQHLQKENEELKEKVRKLETELEFQKMLNAPVNPVTPWYPDPPQSPWYYNPNEPWWEKGPTCCAG